jgi:hypothetical protein
MDGICWCSNECLFLNVHLHTHACVHTYADADALDSSITAVVFCFVFYAYEYMHACVHAVCVYLIDCLACVRKKLRMYACMGVCECWRVRMLLHYIQHDGCAKTILNMYIHICILPTKFLLISSSTCDFHSYVCTLVCMYVCRHLLHSA